MDQRQVWRATLGELEISLSQATFETWFRRTALIRVDEASSTFVLGVASGFAKDWIEEISLTDRADDRQDCWLQRHAHR